MVSNISEPLHLPNWTTTLVILLLAIGFPITAIFSWIFDVTPERLKKTGPIKVGKEKETAAKPVFNDITCDSYKWFGEKKVRRVFKDSYVTE